MKKVFSLITAGFVGGLMALYVGNYFSSKETDPQVNQSPRAILASSATNAPFDFVKAAQLSTPAVAHITVEESKMMAQQRMNKRQSNPFDRFFDMGDMFGQEMYPRSGAGSGVVISEDGYIVTNNHVVENGDIIKVVIDDREFIAEKVGKDPSTDIALLKVEATGLTPVVFADSDELEVGEWVAAVGNPFSYLKSTVTAGIVSAKGRDIDILQNDKAIEEFIQTDAAINPGNSGGALVNVEGELVGINTAIATPTGVYAGYGFAVPSNLVKRIIDDIKEGGDIERGRLGIAGNTIDDELYRSQNLSRDTGFLVEEIVKGSGAQYSGVLPGDIVIGANGKTVDTFEDLLKVVEIARVGDTIELDIVRKNKVITIPVYLRKGI
ncbi:MAG: trypsin-like serine protease [Saprospiraceae bacterium]|nr:trypsin-like serine protease [Saprospiraceae bacterium]